VTFDLASGNVIHKLVTGKATWIGPLVAILRGTMV